MNLLIMTACLVAAFSASAIAAEIKVLSAGAVEPGLRRAAEADQRGTGNTISIQFNTAPALVKKLADGVVADILIAPPGVLDAQAKDGRIIADGRTVLGRGGAGIVVRAGAALPVVYNTASSGLYIEKMLERIGVADQIKAKTQRYPTGEAVMMHIIGGKGNEIGFGATTEIKQFEPKGAKLVGPLPAELQNYTTYGTAMLANAPTKDAAKAFLAYLATPEAEQI